MSAEQETAHRDVLAALDRLRALASRGEVSEADIDDLEDLIARLAREIEKTGNPGASS